MALLFVGLSLRRLGGSVQDCKLRGSSVCHLVGGEAPEPLECKKPRSFPGLCAFELLDAQ